MLVKGINEGFKDVDLKQGIVKGQWSAHNVKDLGGDISEYGFSTKSIQERGPKSKGLIKFCLNHEKKGLPGVLTELWEEPQGGFYAAKAGTHNAGMDFVKMVESGIVNQHSYGYRVIKETFDQQQKANILKEIMLYEVYFNPLKTLMCRDGVDRGLRTIIRISII
jgi:HK97 family phage prohead protease